MKHQTIVRIDYILERVDKINTIAVVAMGTIITFPLLIIYNAWKVIVRKVGGKVYDSNSDKWITKEEYENKILREKQRNREVPLNIEKHSIPQKNERFYFFEKRKLILPYDKLVYVETEYNDRIRRFFRENIEWLDSWQNWHGMEIIEYNYDEIKEGMFYPQDFAVFKHGFLWHSPAGAWDKESNLFGQIHYYYEIDVDSEAPIKKQMDLFMCKIYKEVDYRR